MSLEVHGIPVISTAHLTKEVADVLTKKGDGNPWVCCVPWGYGYFICLDDLDEPYSPDGDPVPQCLLDICNWRRKLEREGKLDNSRWVRLDCDADRADSLPTYDW